jgi:hypothetical protein
MGWLAAHFQGWLDPERYRSRQRERYANDPEYRERKLERNREWYWNLSGFEYNRLLLRLRRNKGLKRIEQREQRRQEEH